MQASRSMILPRASSRQAITRVFAKSPTSSVKVPPTAIKPKNAAQERFVKYLRNEHPHIVLGTGAAGTGKTFWATMVGMEKLQQGEISRIILTRPAVCVEDEQHGFLPGTIESKMRPWILPVYDSMYHKVDSTRVEKMIMDQQLEVAPLAFMRGRTFENAWIILDEAQNCTVNQMKMVLTRIGKGSKLVITGDPTQHDRNDYRGESGLIDLMQRLAVHGHSEEDVAIVHFTEEDVERHPVIPFIIKLYERTV